MRGLSQGRVAVAERRRSLECHRVSRAGVRDRGQTFGHRRNVIAVSKGGAVDRPRVQSVVVIKEPDALTTKGIMLRKGDRVGGAVRKRRTDRQSLSEGDCICRVAGHRLQLRGCVGRRRICRAQIHADYPHRTPRIWLSVLFYIWQDLNHDCTRWLQDGPDPVTNVI